MSRGRKNLPRLLGTLIVIALVVALGLGSVLAAFAEPAEPSTPAQPDVIGGHATSTKEYPWVVALTDSAGGQYCGGSLVAPKKVLTAAHCVSSTTPRAIRVVAGRTDLRRNDGSVVGVDSMWVHPRFRSATRGYDVAVLTLAEAVPYQPIPLASPAHTRLYDPGTQATVFGWGRVEERGPGSPMLRGAVVPELSDAECADAYSRYDPRLMMCAGYPDGGVDTCQGDSGGPLVVDGRLVGVTSWGVGCARPGLPGVYARVVSYHHEITAQL
jgi:trypsin